MLLFRIIKHLLSLIINPYFVIIQELVIGNVLCCSLDQVACGGGSIQNSLSPSPFDQPREDRSYLVNKEYELTDEF